jgi:hypothetical protein
MVVLTRNRPTELLVKAILAQLNWKLCSELFHKPIKPTLLSGAYYQIEESSSKSSFSPYEPTKAFFITFAHYLQLVLYNVDGADDVFVYLWVNV